MIRYVLFPIALMAASPASALTVFPDCDTAERSVSVSFQEFDGYSNPVQIVLGRFHDGDVIYDERYGRDDENSYRKIKGWFGGNAASGMGFDVMFSKDVLIHQTCYRDECHPKLDDTRYLAFLEKTSDGYVFEPSDMTCAYQAFENPTQIELDQAIACLNGDCPN